MDRNLCEKSHTVNPLWSNVGLPEHLEDPLPSRHLTAESGVRAARWSLRRQAAMPRLPHPAPMPQPVSSPGLRRSAATAALDAGMHRGLCL